MTFDQIADKVLAIVVLALLFDKPVPPGILPAVGLPLAAVLWLKRRYRAWRDCRQGKPWRVYG